MSRLIVRGFVVGFLRVIFSILGLPGLALAEERSPGLSEADARQLATVTQQLNDLAARFDLDKNESLSAAEQDELIKSVAKQFGQAWADRSQKFLRSADTDSDKVISRDEFLKAIARLSKYQGKKNASTPTLKTYMVEMRDGAKLATDVYLPDGEGPFPVILTRTPYGRGPQGKGLAGFAASGEFAVVAQDMRGRFESQGDNLPFVGCGWGEHQDGVDTIAWIHKQSWAGDKLATIGGSAGGITQNLLAGAAPPGLTAQYITVAAASMYGDATYIGGAFRKCITENWLMSNKFDPKALQISRGHPNYDDYWKSFDTTTRFETMNVPAVHIGGWFDTFSQGTIDEFVGRQHRGATGSRGQQKLVMGPWTHSIGLNEKDAELRFSHPEIPQEYGAAAWFGQHLLGIDTGIMRQKAVAYYTLGDTKDPKAPGNEWRYVDDWPVAHRDVRYFFHANGGLSADRPKGSGKVEFTFDPKNPCPTIGGANLTIARGPRNQNPIEKRGDVVLFTTEPLAEPLEITGRLAAEIYVSSSAVDSDLSVRLCDVYPDGKSYNIAEGMLRLRFRKSFEHPEPLKPGQVEKVTVDCWSTSLILNRGHRLRIAVTSSNYPRFDLNPGTGKPWVDGEPNVKQTNSIQCDAEHPSCIILPVPIEQ